MPRLPDLNRQQSLLAASGGGLVAIMLAIADLPTLRGPTLLPFVALYTLAFGLYVLALWVVTRNTNSLPSKQIWLFIGLVALAMRAVHWGDLPTLSDDAYRYLWDGHLLANGVSPYAYPVESPALDYLTIPIRESVNHTWMASPYFPTAQGFFWLVAVIGGSSTTALQISVSLLDLLTGGLIVALLRRLDLNPLWGVVYLWHPLVALEFGHSAHIDALMLALCVGGLLALASQSRRAFWLSPILLGLATLVKPLPVFLGPVLVWKLGWRRSALWAGIALALCLPFILINGLGYPGPVTGTGLLGATRIYAARWNFNAGPYHWFETLLTGEVVPWGASYDAPGVRAARVISFSVYVGLLAYLGLKARQAHTLRVIRLCLLAWGGYFLLTPTVHPWYITAVLALLPVSLGQHDEGKPISLVALPWLWLSYGLAWSYLTYVPDEFTQFTFVRNLGYIPTLALLAMWLIAGAYRRQRQSQPAKAHTIPGDGPGKDSD